MEANNHNIQKIEYVKFNGNIHYYNIDSMLNYFTIGMKYEVINQREGRERPEFQIIDNNGKKRWYSYHNPHNLWDFILNVKSMKNKVNIKKVKFFGSGEMSNKGVVCAWGLCGDFTLCGTTLDGDSDTAGEYVKTEEKINCKKCFDIIAYCKKISIYQITNGKLIS